jgi:hypothetical protein
VRLADVISRLEGSMNPFREGDGKPQSMLVIAVGQLEGVWEEVRGVPAVRQIPRQLNLATRTGPLF